MNRYKLIYLDKENNELTSVIAFAENIKEARAFAARKLAASNLNDLKRIKVIRLWD